MKTSSNFLITGEPIELYIPPDGGSRYEYISKHLGHIEWTDLAYMAGQNLSEEVKYIIAGICRNNKERNIFFTYPSPLPQTFPNFFINSQI